MQKLEILPGINPKDFFESKHIITYAFSIGDRHYFRFDDPLNIPYKRGLQTLVYYRELAMNCDHDFLKAHTQAFDNAFLKNKIDINTLIELKQLNDQLKQRLELPREPDLMYKLASVVFFDQHESPDIYEFAYGERKIRAWKKNLELQDFFLSKPLRELIPYLNHAEENLNEFSQMISRATKQHSENILAMLSEEQKTTFLNKFKSLLQTQPV